VHETILAPDKTVSSEQGDDMNLNFCPEEWRADNQMEDTYIFFNTLKAYLLTL
jgi:hypothetical protein